MVTVVVAVVATGAVVVEEEEALVWVLLLLGDLQCHHQTPFWSPALGLRARATGKRLPPASARSDSGGGGGGGVQQSSRGTARKGTLDSLWQRVR